jgi:hypothetical protein
MQRESVQLEMDLKPSLASVSTMRRVVDDLAHQVISDEDASWRLSMAAHELLDNARCHGQDGVAHLRFDIEPREHGHVATVAVRSLATPAEVAHFQELWTRMQAWSDAWAFYRAAIAKAMGHPGQSGLGLARIWAEGEMAVAVAVDDDRSVTVSARLEVEG